MTFTPIKSALDTLNGAPEIHYERRWIGLFTMPNQEWKATRHLSKFSEDTPTVVYWPHVVAQGHVRGRRQLVDRPRPIFPGLLFVSIAIGRIKGYDPFGDIEITPGVRGYLRNGMGAKVYISDVDMCRIEEIEVDKNCPAELHDKCPPKAVDFEVGQSVMAMVDLVNEWRPGVISKRYQDGSYDVDIPRLFTFGRVTTMRLFANQVEAV